VARDEWGPDLWDSGLSAEERLKEFEKRMKRARAKISGRRIQQRANNALKRTDRTLKYNPKTETIEDVWNTKSDYSKSNYTKRLKRMAKTAGGISLGGILFWGFIMYQLFWDKDEPKEVKETPKPIEQVKKTVEKVKNDVDKTITKAKEKLKEDQKKEPESDSPYGSNDVYGDTKSKY